MTDGVAADPSPNRPRVSLRRGAAKAAPLRNDPPRRVLLATAAAPIDRVVIDRAVSLATPEHARITVLGIARVYGTSLGFPNPGLQPNRLEIERLKEIIEGAADELRTSGFEVRVAMSKSRNAPKMIARWVKAKNFHAIVVPDPERPSWRRKVEGDLKREIERRCGVPVYAVPIPRSDRRAGA